MRTHLNKYMYLVVILLLSSFANINANNITSNIEDAIGMSIFETLKVTPIHTSTLSFNESKDNTDHNPLGDLTESEEVEEYEESMSSKKTFSKANIAFINGFEFNYYSSQLQKNLQYLHTVVSKPTVKLHLKLQTFRI